MRIYLIGSLRNAKIATLANKLRKQRFISEVFDDWHAAGRDGDDRWQAYERKRGRGYKEALKGKFAQNGFNLDKRNLESSDVAIMLMPAGKSAHLELGYASNQAGKKTYILFDKEPPRFDLMYNFATDIFFSEKELFTALKALR